MVRERRCIGLRDIVHRGVVAAAGSLDERAPTTCSVIVPDRETEKRGVVGARGIDFHRKNIAIRITAIRR
jgi:hypothetical protein